MGDTPAKGAKTTSVSPTDDQDEKPKGTAEPAEPTSDRHDDPPATQPDQETDPLDAFRQNRVEGDEDGTDDTQPDADDPAPTDGETSDDAGDDAPDDTDDDESDDADGDDTDSGDGDDTADGDEPDAEEDDRIPDEDFKKLSRRARKRIHRLNRWKKENREFAQVGQFVETFMSQNQVDADEFNFLLQTTAAMKRNDPRAVETLEQLATNLRKELNLPPPQPKTPQRLKPLEGDLPQAYQDLVEIHGLDEKRVRLWAAAEQAAVAPPPPPEPEPPRQPQAPAPEVQMQERLANVAIARWLEGKGVPQDQVVAYVQKTLGPELVQFSTNGQLSGIPLNMREQAVKLAYERVALQKEREKAPPAPAPQQLRAPQPVSGRRGGTAPPAKPPKQPADPLDAYRAERVADD